MLRHPDDSTLRASCDDSCFGRSSGQPPRVRRAEAGITLVEAALALVVLTVATVSALGTLVASTSLDQELKERSIALRAAVSKMEAIVAYDYAGNIDSLINYWVQPSNATFTVAELRPQTDVGGTNLPQGVVTFDSTDHDRISVTVTIRWQGRRGPRSLTLPMTLTEVKP